MGRSVGIGIIGTGFGRRVQMPAFKSCDNAAIVSVASGSLENARAAAAEFDVAHFTDDWRETVLRDDVDLVCITTPPDRHCEMTLFALERDKHVLCEKPMTMNVAQAEEMLEAAQKASVFALIDHELRFLPGRLRARDIIRSGELGKIRHAKYSFRAPSRGDAGVPWNWWSDAQQGGGALGAINSHVIDSFHWFLETEISNVFCQLQTHIKERRDASGNLRPVTSDDEANMLLRFRDSELTEDVTGLVSVSMTEQSEYANRIEIFGSRGAIRVDNLGEVSIAKSGEREWTSIEVDLGSPIEGVGDTGFARGFLRFAPRIVEAISDGRKSIENAATFHDGLKVQRVLDAARTSNASRCAVVL